MLRNGVPNVRAALVMRLDAVRERLRAAAPSALGPVRWDLRELELNVDSAGRTDLVEALRRLIALTEVADGLPTESTGEAEAIHQFLDEGLDRLRRAAQEPGQTGTLLAIRDESDARWGKYIALLTPAQPASAVERDDADEPDVDSEALLRLFGLRAPVPAVARPASPIVPIPPTDSLLEGDFTPAPESDALALLLRPSPAPPSASVTPEPPAHEDFRATDPLASVTPEASAREDFRADAEELLERIEALARIVSTPGDQTLAQRELDRCLHTLKGAAGAIGLLDIVATIDTLEDWREHHPNTPPTVVYLDQLQGLLGQVEETLTAFRAADTSDADEAGEPTADEEEHAGGAPAAVDESDSSDESDDGATVRIPRGKVNDLLDLVAESLILHGPRGSWVGTLKGFADAARSCRHRLGLSIERLCDLDRALIRFVGVPDNGSNPSPDDPLHAIGELADQLGEQAEDIALLSQSVRAAAERMAEDLDASARLTRRLWDLLHEVRIIPVRSLFRRLARVAQAVALSDGRRIEVVLAGEEIGLDRPVQDRVFEPLLHIVRNALGHGIEPPDERTARGKPRDGRVTLEARRDGNSVVLEVRDDGRGLDYAAIEAKGRRLGLVGPGQAPSVDELQALIFQPGFTTRDEADSIAGRGIGMDVVAREVARLQGTIALASRTGAGTAISVRLPARLTLEQALLFRVDAQAFALPLGVIEWNEPGGENSAAGRKLNARETLGLPPAPDGQACQALGLRVGSERLMLMVDEVDGPQELVVRPLHPLLADHPLVLGSSLSADGELVLVLDAPALAGRPRSTAPVDAPITPAASPLGPVLVVDDSISIRHSVVRHLHALGLEAVEATDGADAVRIMQQRPPRLVITDLQMPGMDGYELLAALRQRSERSATPPPPILVSSSRADPATRRRVFELGASGFIPKPVSFDELAEAISPFLPSAGNASFRPGPAETSE